MKMGALFDSSGTYRYALWREWNAMAPRVAFVMLNPSTADATTDDPTIRKCLGFARSWGYGSFEVVNLFAYRATDPALLRRVADPVGPQSDRYLLEASGRAAAVIAAWGNHGTFMNRDRLVLALLAGSDRLRCLGTTRSGHPRHPLYVRGDVAPVPWNGARAQDGV